MAYDLYIPPCIHDPHHPMHLPPRDKPLRIQIEGPLVAVQRLLPTVSWDMSLSSEFPQKGGPELARLTYRQIYGQDAEAGDLVVRDEYLGWVVPPPIITFDYYGVTFDHLVPADDPNPEVLQINILELEVDEGPFADGVAYAQKCLRLDKEEITRCIGKSVLAVPRCCSTRRGTQDRRRVNNSVTDRETGQWDDSIGE